ncbi:hypothetical protein VHEMI01049 [[Torrubiella] hemipterigena]|uniref:Vacuolar protein sorting-associated protein 54 C-terminal domain-containing protein n=1 Tax=[Torrubiella] hemipterigena TaxID=1531966 RepID=A0A0A1T3N6_9HYPO|nr:hypothetical protein VHEMI01049 [[Torrubiella] hemipterigena]
MLSSPMAGKSVDSLSPLASRSRNDLPQHSNRPGTSHGPHSRRGSAASSIGGALQKTSSSWNLDEHQTGNNAISTLLSTPIIRTGLQAYTSGSSSAHRIPTARDIPPVTLTNIPKIDAAEFNDYLSQVGALYEQLRRVQENDEESSNTYQRQEELNDPSNDGLLSVSKNRSSRRGSTASLSSLGSLEAGSRSRRSSISYNKKGAQGPPPLSTIPNVYFDDDFHLENPRTFDVVSERSEVIRTNDSKERADASAPRKALATNAILQEKLSWYMDTIEVHLVSSISTASTTFFSALGSLKELHSEASDSVERIKALRLELEALDAEIATTGLEIVQKSRRQENLRQLNDAVAQLKRVVDGIATCESLVDGGEVDKALIHINAVENLIAGEADANSGVQQGTLRDLRGAIALQGVTTDLASLRFRIGKAYELQFGNILMADLRRHVESVTVPDVLLRWSNAASRARGGHSRTPSMFPTYLSATEELKAQLEPVMAGLESAHHVSVAAMAYKDAVLREVRNIIRRPLPSSSDDDNMSMMSVSTAGGGRNLSGQEKSVNLARNLRALDPEDAEELLVKIYIGVTETLRRLSTQVKVLLDIAASLSNDVPDGMKSPPFRSPLSSPRPERFIGGMPQPAIELQEELHKTLDVSNLSAQAVDVANDKIVKILKVRSEQSTTLPLVMFLRYFTLNLYFANECEAISGRVGSSLKTVVNNHIKEFVQQNRDLEMQKLAQAMESDQWGAKDFDEASTKLLNEILECSTQDAESWLEGSKLWIPTTELGQENLGAAAAETNGTEKEKSRPAVIESEKFLLPNSAILCLKGIGNFLHLVAGIPSMTNDVATSLLAYLQLFNSRCTQLILGAGATRSAGLKNITTKHLALASLALSFIATLVPHIREFMRRHAGSSGVSTLMGEFDKIRRVLQEHQDSIHQKLVEIMSGRAAVHSKSIRATKWDEAEATAAHAYMETLAKETTTLHRVLTKHLPETSIHMIMLPVFASYKEQLGGAFTESEVKTKAGKDSMLRDIELFCSKLGKLDGFADAGEHLKDIVDAKDVAAPPPPPPAKEEPKEDKDAVSSDAAGEQPSKDEEASAETAKETTSSD